MSIRRSNSRCALAEPPDAWAASSQAARENQGKQNDQQDTDEADAVVAETVAVASEAAAEAAKQEDDENEFLMKREKRLQLEDSKMSTELEESRK